MAASENPDPAAWGVAPGFRDANGTWRRARQETVDAILEAMGADAPRPPKSDAVVVTLPGERRRVGGRGLLITEDGGELAVDGALPANLPLGYHVLQRDEAKAVPVIVSPGRCHLPAGLRAWGWAVQLYALRSSRSWGIGDLGDLADLGRWAAGELGAGMLVVSPLHAASATLPQQSSPYSPSSRRFRNPLYLRIENVPGAEGLAHLLPAAAGRDLNRDRHIDRAAVFALKMPALTALWDHFGGSVDFDHFCEREGGDLEGYATFCALSEEHGPSWSRWPAGLRHPDSPAVARFGEQHRDRVRFHQWLQWLVDSQLAAAAAEIDLIQDLALGVDPEGADSWLWQRAMAPGISIGAPPDQFNAQGQNWGLAALDPWQLRAMAYEPFVQTVRAGLRGGGGLRVDHVMGLFRLYWIPEGADADLGAYVEYPAGDMLDILALESHRAGAYVVGEDLGTVEPAVREELADRDILSYRLLWFEDGPPSAFPARALAAVTTHDLPTIAGVWTGRDLAMQRHLGLAPDEVAAGSLTARLRSVSGDRPELSVDEVVARAYAALGRAPSALLAATLDDVLGVAERPNMPGTVDEWPNWSIALPASLEDIVTDPRARRIARRLRR